MLEQKETLEFLRTLQKGDKDFDIEQFVENGIKVWNNIIKIGLLYSKKYDISTVRSLIVFLEILICISNNQNNVLAFLLSVKELKEAQERLKKIEQAVNDKSDFYLARDALYYDSLTKIGTFFKALYTKMQDYCDIELLSYSDMDTPPALFLQDLARTFFAEKPGVKVVIEEKDISIIKS